jgi:hypothetical protein
MEVTEIRFKCKYGTTTKQERECLIETTDAKNKVCARFIRGECKFNRAGNRGSWDLKK